MGEVPDTSARLQELLRRVASRAPIKQVIMAVESGDRSFCWNGALGEATRDGTALRANSPFFIASIDKMLNATIAMKLSEAGRLDLDATISTYLPDVLTRGLHRPSGIDYSDRITIRHLLGHTSGLADWLEDRPKGGRSLVERLIRDGDMSLGIEEMTTLVRDELRPHFPPQDLSANRQRIRYSDTNYMLLIAVIEAVAGQPLHQVHERLLFRPLHLRHTYFAGSSQPLDPTPEPPVLRFEGRPLHIPLLLRSVKGIYSTAEDTLAFLRALVRGAVFQDAKVLASMQQHWNRFGFPLDRAALRAPGWPIEYGLGIMRFRLPRVFTPLSPMPEVVGHTGSTGCWLFHCPELDVVLTGSVDEVTAGAVPYRVVPKILQILRSSSQGIGGR
ncbi:MAG TPA: serine hydrolase domain-containing protein [Vicinamibacteria bacterium]|nr:serine hydrolase domain-containing protein [Vicinamibacteria bacterium]